MDVFSLQRVDGATMNMVLIGLKVIFVITLLIGPVSEIRSHAGPLRAGPRCQDFFGTDESVLPAESNTIGITTVYTVSGAPRTHKHTFLT
jgi:hypothetical protein